MATVYHRYIAKGEKFEPPAQEIRHAEQPDATREAKLKADLDYTREKERAARSKRIESEVRIAKARHELISRAHVSKQAAFLAISLRQHLLSIASQHASELLNVSDEREMSEKLNQIIRAKLDIVADFPARVTDEKWVDRLDDDVETTRRAKRKLVR